MGLTFRRCDVPADATFRNDVGATNPAGYVAAPPVLGTTWTASVDNGLTGNTGAGIVGYTTPLSSYLAGIGDYLLVNVADPKGELLGLSSAAGGGVVTFSASVPVDPAFCGFSFATQGYGFGGGGATPAERVRPRHRHVLIATGPNPVCFHTPWAIRTPLRSPLRRSVLRFL